MRTSLDFQTSHNNDLFIISVQSLVSNTSKQFSVERPFLDGKDASSHHTLKVTLLSNNSVRLQSADQKVPSLVLLVNILEPMIHLKILQTHITN